MSDIHHPVNSRREPDRAGLLERLFELGVRLSAGMDSGLRDMGLTRARAEVIWRLTASGPITQRALSDQLRVTPRNVTTLVDALESEGFVQRRPHPSDRRATLLHLTARGKEAAQAMRGGYEELAAQLFDSMSSNDLVRLDRLLQRLIAALRRSDLGPGAGRADGEASSDGPR